MKRKKLIIWLLVLSWPVGLAHRCMNGWPEVKHHMFPLLKGGEWMITYQWYVCSVGQELSYCMVFLALFLYLGKSYRRDHHILTFFHCICIVQGLDLISLILTFKQSELILMLESVVMVYAAAYYYMQRRNF